MALITLQLGPKSRRALRSSMHAGNIKPRMFASCAVAVMQPEMWSAHRDQQKRDRHWQRTGLRMLGGSQAIVMPALSAEHPRPAIAAGVH